jgi:hypothetical protein
MDNLLTPAKKEAMILIGKLRFSQSEMHNKIEMESSNMADCVCLPKCVFFNDKMADMPATADRMKKRYCQGDNSNCARFMVFNTLGREKVPANLFPQNTDRAGEILAAG